MEEMRELFLSYLEKENHTRIKRYPVVARWRDDVFFVGASIYDFQPWVTEGLIPPPANPLAISQPCVRMTDLDLVGKSGRHLTEFEMMAHHAFNSPTSQIYWNDETVRLCYDFFTHQLGISPERINFVEDMWVGGGNAGEDFEVVVEGIEVATLVFMQYKTLGDQLQPLKNQTVDTGYGLERLVWLSKGTPTIYDAVLGGVVEKLRSLSEVERPEEKIYGLADHTRSLIFMLGDGVVPSNMGAGYLARLLIRRAMRNLDSLKIEKPLQEIMALQLEEVSKSFPEYKEKVKILEIIEIEERRYRNTLKRGISIVSKMVEEASKRGRGSLGVKELIQLYDSHGLTPDYVAEVAKPRGVKIEIPEDFFDLVAKHHSQTEKSSQEPSWVDRVKGKFESLDRERRRRNNTTGI